jgi:hypothetical protein
LVSRLLDSPDTSFVAAAPDLGLRYRAVFLKAHHGAAGKAFNAAAAFSWPALAAISKYPRADERCSANFSPNM